MEWIWLVLSFLRKMGKMGGLEMCSSSLDEVAARIDRVLQHIFGPNTIDFLKVVLKL